MTHASSSALEQALRRAAADPAARRDLYKVLLDSTVYILAQPSAGGAARIEAGDKISIQHWRRTDGSPLIPFFSSPASLQASIAQSTTYLALPARSLFEITMGASLMLDPLSPHAKEFLPFEVKAMLTSFS